MLYEHLLSAVRRPQTTAQPGTLLISVNPDLKTDFGHFLNYEKRMNEVCARAGVTHHCLCNKEFETNLANFSPVFTDDSGHYCLYRGSAKGKEKQITQELYKILMAWFQKNRVLERYKDVIVFIYQGSSPSAALLSCLDWPQNVRVIANAFWDFLVPMPKDYDPNLSRLKLQTKVSLLVMSISHQRLISERFGLQFPSIQNPPPLVSDARFVDIMRASLAEKMVRSTDTPCLLLPGLMTAGKGRELTEEFILTATKEMSKNSMIVRDRKGELSQSIGKKVTGKVSFAKGDFTDDEIISMYRTADAALLPYASAVFNFRTSGALVDCLMSGTVPIVFPNTWLADICEKYGFGIICKDESLDAMLEAAKSVRTMISKRRHLLLESALAYLRDNSWEGFIRDLLPPAGSVQDVAQSVPAALPVVGTVAAVATDPDVSALAANLLLSLRDGDPARASALAAALEKRIFGNAVTAAQKDHAQKVLAFYRRGAALSA